MENPRATGRNWTRVLGVRGTNSTSEPPAPPLGILRVLAFIRCILLFINSLFIHCLNPALLGQFLIRIYANMCAYVLTKVVGLITVWTCFYLMPYHTHMRLNRNYIFVLHYIQSQPGTHGFSKRKKYHEKLNRKYGKGIIAFTFITILWLYVVFIKETQPRLTHSHDHHHHVANQHHRWPEEAPPPPPPPPLARCILGL